MSITIQGTPKDFSPAYNPNYFYLSSTNSGETGFRFVVNLINDDTTEQITSKKIAPRPSDSYGEWDVSKIVQQTLSYNFSPASTAYLVSEHELNYYLELSEEYIVSESATSYSIADSTTWPNHGSTTYNPYGQTLTRLVFGSATVFSIGDVINVEQTTATYYRPELEGVHTVVDVYDLLGVYYIVIDLVWIGTGGGASPSNVTYADGQKTLVAGFDSDVYTVFKGALPFIDYPSYVGSEYVADDSSALFLTTLPDDVRISRNQPSWLSAKLIGSDNYMVFNIDGELYRYEIGLTGLVEANILPSDSIVQEWFNGSIWTTPPTIDLSGVETYTVQIQQDDGTELTAEKTISLYSECDFHETFDVCFFDRLGSWITIPFNKAVTMNQAIEKQTYRKKFGDLSDGGFTYGSTARGKDTYHSQENISYTINTGLLSESESQYFRELASSPQVFVSVNSEDFRAIDITNTNIDLFKKRTTRKRTLAINFTFAVQDGING